MTTTELEQLEARAEQLWVEFRALEKPCLEKRAQWCAIHELVEKERERAKIRAEILKEQQK